MPLILPLSKRIYRDQEYFNAVKPAGKMGVIHFRLHHDLPGVPFAQKPDLVAPAGHRPEQFMRRSVRADLNTKLTCPGNALERAFFSLNSGRGHCHPLSCLCCIRGSAIPTTR